MEKRTRWLMVFVFALVFGLAAGVTNADLIAYEPFNYTPAGTDLEGANAGTGWADAWMYYDNPQAPPPLPNGFIVGEGSLVHPDFGGRISTEGNHGIVVGGQIVGGDYYYRNFQDNVAVQDGRDIWFSALFQSVSGEGEAWFGLLGWGSMWCIDHAEMLLYNPQADVLGLESEFHFMEIWQPFPDPTAVHWVVFKWATKTGGPVKATCYGWFDPDPSVEPTTADPSYAGSQNIRIRGSWDFDDFIGFDDAYGQSGNFFKIDEIRFGETYRDVSGTYDPKLASNPRPEAGEENVDPNLDTLMWDRPDEVYCTPTFDMYFGTDPALITADQLVTNQDVNSVDISSYNPMPFDTQHYWRVDVHDPCCDDQCQNCDPVVREGRIWSFTTWPWTPIILQQPEDVFVPAGDPATFTVVSGGNLAGTHTYQWYGQTAGVLSDAGKYTGTNTSTLNISNVQVGEEDHYYCNVQNFHGDPNSNSDKAALVLTKLRAWYKFQNNANDSAGTYNGTEVGAPGYATGVDANMAIDFDGVEEYVDVDSVIGVIDYERLTITAWVKPDPGPGARGVILASHGWETGGIFIDRYPDLPVGVYILGNNPSRISATGYAFPEGEWTFVAFVYDTDEGVGSGKLYFNGKLEAEVEYTDSAKPIPIGPFSMGAWMSAAETPVPEVFFDGKLDDVRIYTYALSPVHIASLYNEMTDESVCVEHHELDLEEDCAIDMLDVRIMADTWLEKCNIVPLCLP